MPTSTVKLKLAPIKTLICWFKRPETFLIADRSERFSLHRCCRVRLFGAVLIIGLSAGVEANITASGQTLRARISVSSTAPPIIRIEADLPQPVCVVSFRNAYGGVLGLGERIAKLEGTTASGDRVTVQKLGPGEFKTSEKITGLSYEVNVSEPSLPTQMSHVSWLTQEHGLLMLADLLPQSTKDSIAVSNALVDMSAPAGWTITSNARNQVNRSYLTDDPDNAVFLIGSHLRETRQRTGGTNVSIVTSGTWPMSHSDLRKVTGKLLEEYSRLTGFRYQRDAVLMLLPFSGETGPEKWSAETRDNNVVLLLGRRANKKRILSSLGIVLSHELFHLWVPNSLKLTGDYDWFFEGFTLYQALRTDLRFGWIRFEDYLNTIARVYDSYLTTGDDNLSLIEASERRWTTMPAFIYDKGMLTALTYDLVLRNRSACRASLDDVYRRLFQIHSTGQGSANETIIDVLTEPEGLKSFGLDYVENASRVNFEAVISAYGIQLLRESGKTKLVVSHNLDKDQRRLLDCLSRRN